MIQLNVLSGKSAGRLLAVRRFPFHIGRAAGNQLVLDDAGVWAEHVSLEFDRTAGILLKHGRDALTTVNAQPAEDGSRLRNGDVISLGAVKIQFSLSAPVQRGLQARENFVWALLAILLATQLVLLCHLPH